MTKWNGIKRNCQHALFRIPKDAKRVKEIESELDSKKKRLEELRAEMMALEQSIDTQEIELENLKSTIPSKHHDLGLSDYNVLIDTAMNIERVELSLNSIITSYNERWDQLGRLNDNSCELKLSVILNTFGFPKFIIRDVGILSGNEFFK